MVHFDNIFVFQNLLKDEPVLKIQFIIMWSKGRRMTITSFYNSFTCSIYYFSSIDSSSRFPDKLGPNIPNNILRDPHFCSFTSFWTVSVTPFNNKPKSSSAWTILIMSFISLFDIISVVVLLWPHPNISYVYLHLLLMLLQLILKGLKHF